MLTIIIAIIVVILDQLTKYVAASQGYSHCSVINNFFYLNYSENTGMAWSLFSGHPYLLAILGIVAVLLMVLYLYKNPPKKLESIIFGFIIGGAIGNLIDRLFYQPRVLRPGISGLGQYHRHHDGRKNRDGTAVPACAREYLLRASLRRHREG